MDEKNTLVVLFHGYYLKNSRYGPLAKTIEDNLPDARVFVPKLPLSLFSCADPYLLIRDLLLLIDSEWEKLQQHATKPVRIILVGHSTGAIIARKIYIAACGSNEDAPLEPIIGASEPRPWAKNVERLVLFAGINKGWTISPHLPITELLPMKILIGIGYAMKKLRLEPIAFRTRRGNPFITQLRIQALSMQRHARIKGIGDAMVVQLLGTQDTLVAPDDNIDLITDEHFVYIEIPNSDHINVIEMDGAAGAERSRIMIDALTKSRDELRKNEILPTDQIPMEPDDQVTDVVFVIHGIRDTGYWTQKIARRVKSRGDQLPGRKFAIETSSYGYFPMLHFLLTSSRRRKVEWFMDQYIENLSLYPNAEFSFIGHSNGTYLLARALRDYPVCKFRNIVLAGSVVPHHYNWARLIEEKRVGSIYNFVASNDWVVGIFPKTLQTLRLQDLGSGGFDGFKHIDEKYQYKCVHGNHGAAIKESMWDELTHLVIHGEASGEEAVETKERILLMKFLGWFGPVVFILFACTIIATGILIWVFSPEPLKLILTLLYGVVIWRILTRF